MKSALLGAALAALIVCPAYAWSPGGANAIANTSSSARASSIGVGNAFGNQSLSNRNTLSNSNALSNRQTQSQTLIYNDPPAYQGTNAGAANSGNNISSTNLKYPLQAPTAVAPSLGGIGADNCDSAISFGASGPGGGLSFAFPKQNEGCNHRANARMLAQLGVKKAALQALCFDGEMGQALQAAGIRCRVGQYAAK